MPRTEIKPEVLGTAAINSFVANVSSPRAVMDNSHFASHIPLLRPDEKLIKAGIEYELGKTINDVRVEQDCTVKALIPRYGGQGITPPSHTVIVEYEKNDKIYIDFIEAVSYKSQHNFFGYPLEMTADLENISYNSPLNQGAILAKTASYGKEGSYNYGLNANVAFMSHPSVSDDGFVISESFAKRAQFTSITRRVININKNTIPLNLYGDSKVFKFIPNIGEKVREDKLLCALRERNDWFSVADMSTRSLSEFDPNFDSATYVNADSTVIDIIITRGNYAKPEFSSVLTNQLDHYAAMLVNYHQSAIDKFEKLMAEKKALYGHTEDIRLTPRMHRFMTDCYIKVSMAGPSKNKLCHRKLPIDQYRIEVVTMSVITPNYGYKLTDIHASKGVNCLTLPDDQMPMNSEGVRADLITDNTSTISRMNLGRAYEAYLGAMCRDNRSRLIRKLAENYGVDFLNNPNRDVLYYMKSYMKGLYEHISPEVPEWLETLNEQELRAHLIEIVTDNLYIYYPTDNQYNITDVISSIDKSVYKPLESPVTYTDTLGRQVTTKDNVRIGVLYIMFLDKIGNSFSAVSSAKVNNFGFPVKGAQSDKYKYPHSQTPTKLMGETEFRILIANMGKVACAEMMDLALNPNSHKALYRSILEDPKPYDNQYNIDRSVIPYDQTKSLQILRHIFTAAGFDFVYEDEN
jgi:DNA-directed RNA polymerase beta subunit